jgi:6-phosphofructo-2-kinase / fructose-2,6-biphosphatase 2
VRPLQLGYCVLAKTGGTIDGRLKRFDESTVVSRKGSRAPTPPPAVKGIGKKGMSPSPLLDGKQIDILSVAKPDYSEQKIVVAMVRYIYLS